MTSEPPTEAPLPGIELAPRVVVPASVLRFKFVRARGPGGQNVNKVSSACEMRLWLEDLSPHLRPGAIERLKTALGSRLTAAGEVIFVSDERRTQEQNRDAVLNRLRELLVAAMVEPKRRKKTRPSKAAQRRRVESKRARSTIKSQRRRVSED